MLPELGFKKPTIKPYQKNKFSIKPESHRYALYHDDVRYMLWNTETNKEIYELYSHYDLAYGHCICTGLGFLFRESWLLTKPEVTKITVLEYSKDVIEYHREHNSEVFNQLEVIECDANEYKGSCDTLLIDHYMDATNEYNFYLIAKKVCDNIQCKVMWFWPLEQLLDRHYKYYIGLSLKELYQNIKQYFGLTKLPDLSEEQLVKYCSVFFLNNFEVCNFKQNTKPETNNMNQTKELSLFWKWDNAIPKEMCELLLQERKQQDDLDALVGYGDGGGEINPKQRQSKVVWARQNHWIEGILYNHGLYAMQSAQWNFSMGRPQAVQLTKYEKGGFYDWHQDQDILAPLDNEFRKISLTCLLNDPSEFEGGEFEFQRNGETISVPMKQGDIIAFPSLVTHRVAPVTKGVRYSAVCWITGPRML